MKISVYNNNEFIEDFVVEIEKHSRENPYEFTYKGFSIFDVFQENKKNMLLPKNSSLIFNNNSCKEMVLTEWDKIFYESFSFLFTEFSLDVFFSHEELETPFFEDTTFSQNLSSNIPTEIAFSTDSFDEKKTKLEKKEEVERVYSFDEQGSSSLNQKEEKSPEEFKHSTESHEGADHIPLPSQDTEHSEVPFFQQQEEKITEDQKENHFYNDHQKTESVHIQENKLQSSLNDELPDIFSIQGSAEKTESIDNTFQNVKSSTRVDNFFSLYRLKIFGEYAPFDYFVLSKDKITIGRNPECDIVLNDPEVSRKHLELYKTYEGYVVLDISEGNAIFFEGKYTNKVLLSSGVEFSIGATTFKLEVKSSFLKEEESFLMPLLSDEESKPLEQKQEIKKIPPVRIALGIFLLVFLVQNFIPKKNKAIVEKSSKKQENTAIKSFSKEEEEFLSVNYELAKHYLREKLLSEAKEKIDAIKNINPQYKKIQSMEIVINDSLRKIQELDLKKKQEEEAELVKQTVSILAERLNESLKNKDYISVDILVQEILTKDPENLLALEAKDIIAEFKEQEREKAEKLELAEKERKYLLDKMAPGRNYMSQGNYYKAIMFFEDFLLKPISVEDIRVEVSGLLDESKEKLYAITMPLIQEADLAFENKQFKKSYETYEKILEKDPSLVDIIIKLGQLKSFIDHRIKDRYQKAILSESYGYLEESKQYFSEILDTTPEKHIFYKKSEQKLLSYIND